MDIALFLGENMNFQECFDDVLGTEGRYSNDPEDPGKETKFGISKKAYPHLDIANLTLEDAREIYKRDYWDVCKCDDLPSGIDYAVFDCGVNQGVDIAGKLLQESLHLSFNISKSDQSRIDIDGIIGPITVKYTEMANTDDELILDFLSLRSFRYAYTKRHKKYGRGWHKRNLRIARDTAGM